MGNCAGKDKNACDQVDDDDVGGYYDNDGDHHDDDDHLMKMIIMKYGDDGKMKIILQMSGGPVTPPAPCPIPQTPFASGEELSFQVFIKNFVTILKTIKENTLSSSLFFCSAICATPPIHSLTCLLRRWYSSQSSSAAMTNLQFYNDVLISPSSLKI